MADPVEELVHQPRLADTGGPEQREQVGGPLVPRALECATEQLQLLRATDHRRVQVPLVAGRTARDLPQPVGGDGLRLALQLERFHRFDFHRVAHEPVGGLAQEDLAGGRGLFQPGGHVDRVTRDQPLVRALARDHLAGVDADPDGDPHTVVVLELVVQTFQGRLHLRGGPHGAEGVVLVETGDAEHGHHGIADVLLDGPLVAFQDRGHLVEVAGLDPPERFGIEPLADRGRVGHVGEHDRDDLPGLGRRLRCGDQRGRAVQTELRAFRVVLAAGGAAHGGHPMPPPSHDRVLEGARARSQDCSASLSRSMPSSIRSRANSNSNWSSQPGPTTDASSWHTARYSS